MNAHTPETQSMENKMDLPQGRTGLRRRSLMQRAGLGAVAAGALGTGGAALTSRPAQAQAITDNDIANFALNLEYLEAEFYLRAVTGQGLSSDLTTGTGTLGAVTGGSQVPFRSAAIAQYAQLLAVDEQTHVRFLRTVLGSAAVARPAINLSTSFTNLAIAAGLIVAGQTFNPFADDVSFLIGSYIFEDVGVTAYAGSARLIRNKDILEAAGAILATEAYHAAAIRTLLANIGAGQAANAISALRAQASGKADDQGILIPGESYNFVSTDSNALVFRRTPTQVLNIVYLGGAASGFGFFPNRTNGNIS